MRQSFSCTACVVEDTVEQEAIVELLEGLMAGTLQDSFASSVGLCRTHFSRVGDACRDAGLWSAVVRAQMAAVSRLIGSLDEFIAKQDYQRAHEELSEEARRARFTAIDMLAADSRFL